MLTFFLNSINGKSDIENKHVSSVYALAKAAHPGSGFSDYFKQLKMMLRLFIFRNFHQQVKMIFTDRKLHVIALAHPRIYEKIYRTYMYHGATIGERLVILKSHYQFVSNVFSDLLIHSVYVSQNFMLCTVLVPNDNSLITVRLAYRQRFEKEGELTLNLLDGNGRRLYSVSFSIDIRDGKPSVLIGCIIGPSVTESSNGEVIKNLTKGLHGMRPKNLLLFLLQTFCRELGIQNIFAIAAQSHVYASSAKKLLRIKFDYDDFWEEVGGKRRDKLLFSLPLHYERHAYEEIRTNKRAAYARRYAVLEDIEMQVHNALQAVSSGQSNDNGHLVV